MPEFDVDALLATHQGDPAGEIPVIGYLRVSTAREDMISPEIQADAVNAWAARNGRRIVDWYADLDLTGRDFSNRKISTVIERVEAGDAREVGVWKYSRWGRNRALNALNLAHLERVGGQLQSATEEVDATTSVGRFTRGMLMELASFESDRIGEGWKDTHAQRLANGLPANGRERFGYIRRGRVWNGERWMNDVNDERGERYEPDPVTGPILAELYRRYTNGEYFYTLASWLDEQGIPTRLRSARWSHHALAAILDSGFGIGLLQVHNPMCNNPSTSTTRCPNLVTMDGAHPTVFETQAEADQVWSQYQERRARQKNAAPKARASRAPLSGVIRCGRCGGTYTRAINNGAAAGAKWRCPDVAYGRCPSGSIVETAVTRAVLHMLAADADAIEQKAGVHQVRPRTKAGKSRVSLESELTKVSEALVDLQEQHLMKEIDKEEYDALKPRLSRKKAELRRQLDEMKRDGGQSADPDEYVPVLRGLVEDWPTLPVTHRNSMLKRFLSIEAHRESREHAWLIIRTVYGTEKRYEVVSRMGRGGGVDVRLPDGTLVKDPQNLYS